MLDVTRDITLRTLAGDTGAIAQNTQPQGTRVTLHVKTAAADMPMPEMNTSATPAKKHRPLVTIIAVIFFIGALGAGGYFVYKSVTTPYVKPK